MEREKQYVFSARTTAEGLKALGEVKSCFNIGWDELVIESVSAYYNLDKAMMSLPRKEKSAKEAQPTEQPPSEEVTPEQVTATEQGQPAEELPAETVEEKLAEETPAKKKGKGKK